MEQNSGVDFRMEAATSWDLVNLRDLANGFFEDDADPTTMLFTRLLLT